MYLPAKLRRSLLRIPIVVVAPLMLVACGGGGSGSAQPANSNAFAQIVVVGDSISQFDADPNSFAYTDYMLAPDILDNQAAPGQTLVANIEPGFAAALDQSPLADAVIIQGGLNDILQWAGPVTYAEVLQDMQAATESMVAEAYSRGLTVLLVNIAPWGGASSVFWTPVKQQLTVEYNDWLQSYADQTGAVFVDAYARLLEPVADSTAMNPVHGGPIHTNEAGAAHLAELVDETIQLYRLQ